MSDFMVYNNIPRILPAPANVKTSQTLPQNGQAPASAGETFSGMLKDAINQVNNLDQTSQTELKKYLNNESDLHSVMIALEKADVSFQMMMQVRNKIVSAYQEIMKTQV